MSKLLHPEQGSYDFFAIVTRGKYKDHLVFVDDGDVEEESMAITYVLNSKGLYDFTGEYILIPYRDLLELPSQMGAECFAQ